MYVLRIESYDVGGREMHDLRIMHDAGLGEVRMLLTGLSPKLAAAEMLKWMKEHASQDDVRVVWGRKHARKGKVVA